jgi:nucleotidyltransferase substrate binding protein (TIGR01987 family)
MKKFDQYCANLQVLSQAPGEDLTNEFVLSGIIQKFSLQFELGWKVLKRLLEEEGRLPQGIGSPRSVVKAAFAAYDFLDETTWLAMLKAKNEITHLYDGTAAQRLVAAILRDFLPAFQALAQGLQSAYGPSLDEIP